MPGDHAWLSQALAATRFRVLNPNDHDEGVLLRLFPIHTVFMLGLI